MMRRARIPHTPCGSTRVCSRRKGGLRLAYALALLAAVALVLTFAAPPSIAQDPSLMIGGKATTPASSFPKKPGGILGPKPNIDRAQPLYLQADQLLYDTKNNRVIAQGNVEIYYNNYILTADQVVYDQSSNKLIAEGNAQLKDPNGSITRADRFEALDDFRDAFIQSLSVVTADDTRIAAERASRREGNTTEYERAKFTPCKNDPGMPPLWCISAARIVHDQRAATLVYQDAQFEFFGIPVVYLPYFEMPDPTVKHRSGFLMPNFTNSSTLGFGFETPYYFALAPNMDFTFHPKYWSNYGTMLQGEFRHRLSNGQYTVSVAAIDQGRDATAVGSGLNDTGWRGSVQTKGQFSLSSWWRFGWDVTVDSDDSFRRFYQLDPILQTDRVNTVYLQGMSDRNYFGAKLYQFGGLLLTDTPYSNSWVHPVIDYNYILGTPVLGGEMSFNLHARSMSRSTTAVPTASTQCAEVNWRRKMIDPIGQVWTPFANARGDVYNYSYTVDPSNGTTLLPGDTAFRGVGATGVLYSYPFVAHTGFGSHVIEPTAQIIVRQNKRRSEAPAGRGREEPDIRRHAVVRYRQVLGLRPVRDRHARQLRRPVHLPGQQRRLSPRRVRPEPASRRREPLRQSGLRSDRHDCDELLARQRSRDQPLGLCRGHLHVAVQRHQSRQPVALRRAGLDPAPPGHLHQRHLWSPDGQHRLHLHRL